MPLPLHQQLRAVLSDLPLLCPVVAPWGQGSTPGSAEAQQERAVRLNGS